MRDSATSKDRNRRIRQEALREQLSQGKHVEHVIEIANKIANETLDLDALMVQRLKAAAEIKCKLISKYLPDLKAVEVTGEDGEPVNMVQTIRIIAEHGSDSKAPA